MARLGYTWLSLGGAWVVPGRSLVLEVSSGGSEASPGVAVVATTRFVNHAVCPANVSACSQRLTSSLTNYRPGGDLGPPKGYWKQKLEQVTVCEFRFSTFS